MTQPEWMRQGSPHIWLPYAQMKTAPQPLPVIATQGSRLTLADGRRLIDGVASWWTACHGYNHPHIAQAVTRQLQDMPHVMFGGLTHEPALTLAARLSASVGLERVFYTDSGSVAVEVAMKMALQYWLNQGGAPSAFSGLPGRLSWRHLWHDGGLRSGRGHARALSRHAGRSSDCRSAP